MEEAFSAFEENSSPQVDDYANILSVLAKYAARCPRPWCTSALYWFFQTMS